MSTRTPPSAPSGHLFILSAPSGAGKTTLRQALMERFGDLIYSVSYTTRNPRADEREGKDYHFIDKGEFERRIRENRWAEWAMVHGNYYGTSADFLSRVLDSGRDVLLDIDVQGTMQILRRYPASITIFILPPSMEVLRKRLENRKTDPPEAIEGRMKKAQEEIGWKDRYRHRFVNDRLPEALEELCSIIEGYRGTKKANSG